jgi:type VI secretion system protein
MPLRLRIASHPHLVPEQQTSAQLHVGRLSIGRAPGNDWLLQDPLRVVSACHCIVEESAGDYFVIDTSTNGIFLNEHRNRLEKGQRVKLTDGDRLLIGEFTIQVEIDAAIGASPSVSQGLEYRPGERSRRAGDNLSGGRQKTAEFAGSGPPEPSPAATLGRSFGQVYPASRGDLADQRYAAGLPPSPGQQVIGEDHAEGLRRFLAGAGMPDLRVSPGQEAAVLQEAGRLFRRLVTGMMDLLRARHQFRGEWRLAQTQPRPVGNNPLKVSASPEDALGILLVGRTATYAPPMQAIDEGLHDLMAHHLALIAGAQGALSSLFRLFDPALIEPPQERHGARAEAPTAAQMARYWELYKEFYGRLQSQPDSDLGEVFRAEFAHAYEEQIRRLRADDPTPLVKGDR